VSALRIACAGDWSQLDALTDELRRETGVELTGQAHADVVLLSAPAAAVSRAELEAIRIATTAPILLVAADPSEALLDAADSYGIADVVPLPQSAAGVVFAARKAARGGRPAEAAAGSSTGPARVITVFSPKGGTGKTTTSCNLAAAAAAAGRRTLLLDLDLQFGDTAIMLGLEPRKTLHDLVSDAGVMDAEKLAGYVSASDIGIDVLPAPLRPEDAERVGEERVSQLLDVASGVYDVIVVDTSPYFHGPMLATLDRTDQLVLVAAPDVPTLKNLRLTLHTLELLGFAQERTRVVLNRADPRIGLKAGEVGAVLGHAIDFQLPNDPSVPATVNRGVPAVVSRKRCPYVQAFGPFAAEVLGETKTAPARRHRGVKLALGWR
jgi:pilus assembly protein CpaE